MKKHLFVVAIVVSFTGAALAADPKYDAFMGRVVGNQTTVTFGTGGTPLVTSSAGLGNPSIGNMGLSQSGRNVSLAGNVTLPVGGTAKTINATARAAITPKLFLAGIAAAASNPLVGIGIGLAAPSILEWLNGERIGINPDQSSGKPFTRSIDGTSKEFSITYNNNNQWFSSESAACSWYGQQMVAAYVASGYWQQVKLDGASVSNRQCYWYVSVKSPQGAPDGMSGNPDILSRDAQYASVVPASLSDIEPYMDAPDAPLLTPQIVEQAITKAGIDPFGGQSVKPTLTGPETIPGEKTTTSESVKLKPGTTTVADPADPVTEQGTKTTTKENTTKVSYNENTATASQTTITNTNITNNVTNQTINEGDKIEETEQKDITVCGLPGTPACKIDETGTPEAKQDTAEADAKKAIKPLDDFIANPTAALPTLPTINWAFTLPSGCAPIALLAFDPWLQEIDVCAFQPMFHDLMSFVWVLGGIFGAIGTFWRNTFSQG